MKSINPFPYNFSRDTTDCRLPKCSEHCRTGFKPVLLGTPSALRKKMTSNRLIREKSPYLLQHARNPVDWYPWGDEAFARAERENKPVFLSIGYAACHWCHVMEKESFEDEETAGYLNETFVCIKVDREERPDIDAVYMAACHILNKSGGWPLTIFMTSDKKPFFAATYLPRQSTFGRIGLTELCQRIREIWHTQKQKILDSAAEVAGHLSKAFVFSPGIHDLNASVLDRAYAQIAESFDTVFAGFKPAPKFPTPHRLMFLLRYHLKTGNAAALDMAEKTLTAMRLGGLWDHIGFGFHRYSTDTEWLVPHFEKMLYDQAMLITAYLEAFQITKDRFYAETAEQVFAYLLRDMTSPEGAFFAAQDADSQGEEGKFYVWTLEEFRQVLGKDEAEFWEKIFNLRAEGNYSEEASRRKTGANILNLEMPLFRWAEKLNLKTDDLKQRWENAGKLLFEVREQRVHPLKDDKILLDWNGLMIAALAMGARILERPEYALTAQKTVRFISDNMRDSYGRLLHRFRDGEAGIPANANDYAFFIMGLLELYRTLFDPDVLAQAISLQEQMLNEYWDEENCGFFLTAKGNQDLPVRPKEIYDGALPSANAVSLLNMLHIARLTGDTRWENRASEIVRAYSGTVESYPSAYTHFLLGISFMMS